MRHELVAGRSLRRIDPKRVLGRAQVVDVERQLTIPGFEILMQQTLKVVQQINIRPAIDVLVQSVRLVKGGSLFAAYPGGKRIICETLQSFLDSIGALRLHADSSTRQHEDRNQYPSQRDVSGRKLFHGHTPFLARVADREQASLVDVRNSEPGLL